MTLEYILRAAVSSMIKGHHKPHCFTAHIPGQGYTNKGDNPETRADYLRQLERQATSEVENMGFASEYAERGYSQPEKGIVFADWNTFPRGLDTILERAGYDLEWSDEWSICEDCGKAIRTSADSYGWQPYYKLIDDCSIVCLDCLDWPSYLESIEDDATQAVPSDCDLADYGYERLSDSKEYESGLHPGQTDNPATILKALQAKGHSGIVFRIADVGQFDVHFEAWKRVIDTEEGEL